MDAAAGGRPVRETEFDLATPLADLDVGASGRIVTITADSSMTRRCLALGLRVGADITVLHRRGRSVVVVSDGNRVALGADIAAQLMVEHPG